MATQSTVGTQVLPLLRTKFHIPPQRREIISRPRLVARLNAGLWRNGNSARKLTLSSAPAGFGKTTLVSDWVQALVRTLPPIAVAWLSLDESENDPVRFLTYVVTALQTLRLSPSERGEANIGQRALSALQAPQPPIEAILGGLINEIAALPDRIVLVLDDYHLIDAQPVHDALTFLLQHLPPQLHLVITTREDPLLPLGRLRARGQLTELRATDLRFTSAEAAEFLNQAMGLALSTDDVAALERRTEGWIAGLQLAAISMQGRRDVTDFIQSFSGSHRFVLDYLGEDVLEQQSERVQSFLLQTAILDRLTDSLCDAVTGQDSGRVTLKALDRANLFIVPLDDERQWYRYHHLFADLLRQRLRQTYVEQIPTLHLRASEWFEQKDLPSDAIRHALAAEDYERAADLAELAWPAWNESFRAIAWLSWVNELPEDLVRARPVLSMAYAWAFLNAGRLEDAETKLRDVAQWLEPSDSASDQSTISSSKMVVVDEEQFRGLPTQLPTARAYLAQAIGDVQGTVRYVRQVLDLLPEDDHYNRASVTGLLGLAYWASGDLEAAHRIFSEGMFQNVYDLIQGTFVLADMEMTLGHLREALSTCQHALRLATEYGEPIGTEDVYTGMSELHRERGELEAAAEDLATSKKLGEKVELPDWQHRWCIAQARLKATLGDPDSALDFLDEAERRYVRTPVPDVRPIAALRARVWVKQGRLAEAQGWVREQDLSVDDDLSYLREFDHVTLGRVFIARYRRDRVADAVHEAMRLMARLLEAAEEGGRTGSTIEILALQALAYEAQGNIASALVALERALTLAVPEGFIRVFVDEGPPMARLLYEALTRGIAPDFTRRLLAAFPVDGPEHAGPSEAQASDSELIEPLSERELEILQLIAEGLTNPEIASRLYLTLNTVKVHTRNIYGKLGVHNRTQAVASGRALGVLPFT